MSLTATHPLQSAAGISRPQDFILQSYNVFNPIIARDPNNLFSQTSNFLKVPLTDGQINTQTFDQQFSSTYKEYKSSQETHSEFAASLGIEGSYGFYSGSVKASYESDTFQSSTSFCSSFNAFINCGTVTFGQASDYKAIRACLKDEFCAKLDQIVTLKDAETFANTYGTHLVAGLNLGGFLQLKTEAKTMDYTNKESLSLEVKAAYSGVGDISVAASVAQKLSQESHSYSLTESAAASGGQSSLASNIDPGDRKTITDWAHSCTTETAYGMTHALEIWKLAANETAQNMFQKYLNLVILNQSINNPTIFSADTKLIQFALVSVDAVTDNPHFRIIGGGAMLDKNGSSFLVNSYPHIDESTGEITGWTAGSHDIAQSADTNAYLTSYAVAIYDPAYAVGNKNSLLAITVKTAKGSNPNIGGDTAAAKVDAGYLLSGGGIESFTPNKVNKFILSSYPSTDGTWTVANHDYEIQGVDVTLTAFAIGIKSQSTALTITPSLVATPGSQFEYGNQVAKLGGGMVIAGGGVSVQNATDFGNMVQQSYPSSANSWTEYDKDDDGHVSYANCAAYAIGFTAGLDCSK